MSDLVNIHKGRRGDKGAPGETGIGVDDIRLSLLDSPVLNLLNTNKISSVGNATFHRDGEALIKDRYGKYIFINGGDITNLINYSNDFSQWSDIFNRWSISSTGNPDPLGGNSATIMSLDSTTSEGDVVVESPVEGLSNDSFNTVSFWFKKVSGSISALNITFGTNKIKVDDAISSEFVRLRVTVTSSAASVLFSVDPVGSVGAEFIVFGAQVENGSIMNDYIETTGAPVTIPNTSGSDRENGLGYLIEDTKQNLILNSEDLTESTWLVDGLAISEYQESDLFNDRFKNVRATFTNKPSATITTATNATIGFEYAFSVFVKVVTGSFDELSVSMGGDKSILTAEEAGDYSRYTGFVSCLDQNLVIEIISPNQNADIIIEGFQLESGNLSSYIRTVDFSATRNNDVVSVDELPLNINSDWTFTCKLKDIQHTDEVKYIFYSSELSMYYQGASLVTEIGGVTSTINAPFNTDTLSVVKKDNLLSFYVDSFIYTTATNSGIAVSQPVTLKIGGDNTVNNGLNAYISQVRFYDKGLTAEEIRTLMRID